MSDVMPTPHTPLILLPGMNLSVDFWDRCAFADSARVVVPWGSTIDEAVAKLDEEITEPSVLVGLSLGGILAMAYTRWHPDKVSGLVLMATNAKGPTDAQIEGWQKGIAELGSTADTRGFQKGLLPLLLSPASQKSEDIVNATLESAAALPSACLIEQLNMQQTRIDERPYLSQVSVPVEILAGRHDALCPISNHEEILELIDGASLKISEHSGHLIPFEDPVAVDAAIARIFHRALPADPTKENNR